MAAYPTKHIYDDDFVLISIDMNDCTWFVALKYVFFVPYLVLYAYKWQIYGELYCCFASKKLHEEYGI